MVHMSVPAPAAELVKFYQDQLKEKGWEIQSTANMGDGSMLSAKKEGRQCTALVIKQDKDETALLYGNFIPFETILSGKVPPPESAHTFLATVQKYAREASQEKRGE